MEQEEHLTAQIPGPLSNVQLQTLVDTLFAPIAGWPAANTSPETACEMSDFPSIWRTRRIDSFSITKRGNFVSGAEKIFGVDE
jgi:hypothetical protein